MKNKSPFSPTGYQLYKGNSRDQSLLLEFLELTYRSLFPDQASFPHLGQTVDSYFSWRSPLWWVSPDSVVEPGTEVDPKSRARSKESKARKCKNPSKDYIAGDVLKLC